MSFAGLPAGRQAHSRYTSGKGSKGAKGAKEKIYFFAPFAPLLPLREMSSSERSDREHLGLLLSVINFRLYFSQRIKI